MKKILIICFALVAAFCSCKQEGCTDSAANNYDDSADKDDGTCEYNDTYGEVTVDMTADKAIIRVQESLIGNFVSDALYEYGVGKGESLDFAMSNSGGIRFDSETRTDGIYPAGDWDATIVEEVFPFGNTAMVVTVTGEELKSICEWSVADLPTASGHFLNFSSHVVILVDTSLAAQVVDNITDPDNPVITTEGSRITTITIGGTAYSPSATYKILTNNYIGEGNDGFVTLKYLDAADRNDLGDLLTLSIQQYLENNSPVTPTIEGRIVIQ